MHVQRLTIENIRSIRKLDLVLRRSETAGWHVLLGDNGSGKSTVVRALALALMGQSNAHAARQDWSCWLSEDCDSGYVSAALTAHDEDNWVGSGRKAKSPILAKASIVAESAGGKRNERQATIAFPDRHARHAERTIWGGGYGWFSASFGPFRRFSGGDPAMERLFVTHPLLAPHLSAFGENIALGESLLWLQDLEIKKLEKDEDAAEIQRSVIAFINEAELLPHGAQIANVSSEHVEIVDGHGSRVAVEEMSDGYRSILSLTFELMRLMFWAFGPDTVLDEIDTDARNDFPSGRGRDRRDRCPPPSGLAAAHRRLVRRPLSGNAVPGDYPQPDCLPRRQARQCLGAPRPRLRRRASADRRNRAGSSRRRQRAGRLLNGALR